MRAATVEIPRNPSEEGEGLGENPAPVTKGISDEDQENSSSDPSENASERSATDRTTETITKEEQTDPNVANEDAPRTTGRREDTSNAEDKDVKSSTTDLWPENPVTSGRRMVVDGSNTKKKIGEVEVLAQPLLEVGEVERFLQDHHPPSHCHCCHQY